MFRNDSIGAPQPPSGLQASARLLHTSPTEQGAASAVSVAFDSVRNAAEADPPIRGRNLPKALVGAEAWRQAPYLDMSFLTYCRALGLPSGNRFVYADRRLTPLGELRVAQARISGGLQESVDALRAAHPNVFDPGAPPLALPPRDRPRDNAVQAWLQLPQEERDRTPLSQHLDAAGVNAGRRCGSFVPLGLIEAIAWRDDAALRGRMTQKKYADAVGVDPSYIGKFVNRIGTPSTHMECAVALLNAKSPQRLQSALEDLHAKFPEVFAGLAARGIERAADAPVAAAPVPAPAALGAPPTPPGQPGEAVTPPLWRPW